MITLLVPIDRHLAAQADSVIIVLGDFNHANLKTVFPTRENNVLDQVYCNIYNAFKASPLPHLGLSNHLAIFLIPAYIQTTYLQKMSTRSKSGLRKPLQPWRTAFMSRTGRFLQKGQT